MLEQDPRHGDRPGERQLSADVSHVCGAGWRRRGRRSGRGRVVGGGLRARLGDPAGSPRGGARGSRRPGARTPAASGSSAATRPLSAEQPRDLRRRPASVQCSARLIGPQEVEVRRLDRDTSAAAARSPAFSSKLVGARRRSSAPSRELVEEREHLPVRRRRRRPGSTTRRRTRGTSAARARAAPGTRLRADWRRSSIGSEPEPRGELGHAVEVDAEPRPEPRAPRRRPAGTSRKPRAASGCASSRYIALMILK